MRIHKKNTQIVRKKSFKTFRLFAILFASVLAEPTYAAACTAPTYVSVSGSTSTILSNCSSFVWTSGDVDTNAKTMTGDGTAYTVSAPTTGTLTLGTFSNTGNINAPLSGSFTVGMAFDPDSTNIAINIAKIRNLGTITGRYGIYVGTHVTLTELYNSGTIGLQTGDANGVWIKNLATVTTINNSGTIKSADIGFLNQGTIGTLNNTGAIYGTNDGLSNTGTITTINNLQGRGNANGALMYTGKLPTNYNVVVNSTSLFGRFDVTSGTSAMTFGIYSGGVTGLAASSLAVGTYTSVLSGIVSANLIGARSGTYGSFNWTLSDAGSGRWNLVVTAASSGGGGGGNSSSTITVNTGQSVSPSAYPAGTTIYLNGGSIQSTATPITQSIVVGPSGGYLSSSTQAAGSVISGTGPLIVNGGNVVQFNGTNSWTGGLIANGTAVVQNSSSLGSGTVTVNDGGLLMGSGGISGAVTINPGGAFAPGNSPGYLNLQSTLTLNSSSIYKQNIAGTSQANSTTPVGATGYYSFTQVDGAAMINSGATLQPLLLNLFSTNESGYGSAPYVPKLGDQFRMLTATGGISGRFSTLTQPDGLSAGTQFVSFYNMNNSNSIDLAVVPSSYLSTIASGSGNKNAQSVGAALDKIAQANLSATSSTMQDQLLYAASGQTSAASIASYAQSLAGEVYAATVATIAQTTQRVQQAVMSRLGDTMGIGLPQSMTASGNTSVMNYTNTVLAGGVSSASVGSNPGVNSSAEMSSLANGNVWGELAYQKGNRGSDSNSGGWNSNLYQLVFGSDFYAANGLKIGGGLALSNTTLNPTYGSSAIQQAAIFAYGKMPVQEYVVDAMASVGLNSSDVSRGDVTGLSNGFKNKSITGNDAMVSLGFSRPIDVDQVRVTPFARVTWQLVTQSGVNEGDAASALSVKSFTGNGVRGVLGVAAGSREINPMTEQYTYRVYVGVGADSSGLLNPALNASIGGLSTNITTPNAGAAFAQAGLYGTVKVSDNAYAFAGMSGEARNGQTLGVVSAGVRIQF